VDSRERWQALQARLAAARAAVDAGDGERALAAIHEALDIDPDFLAAHSLRDRILAPAKPTAPVIRFAPEGATVSSAPDSRPAAVSSDGYAKFEQRAKRRRMDRRIDAARSAIEHGLLKQAAAALDEVIELDPNLPGLSELTAEFDDLRRTVGRTHRGPWIAAAAVFIITVFGSWLQDSESLRTHAKVTTALIVAPPMPPVTVMASRVSPVATTGDRERPVEAPPPSPGRRTSRAETTVVNGPSAIRPSAFEPSAIGRTPPAASLTVGSASVAAPVPVPVPPQYPPVLPRPDQEPPAVTAIASPAAPAATSVPTVDDELLVRQTLQRYRRAYERLDAQSAQAVYPAVNQAALARAFDGLQSQSLAFDACEMHVRGGSATATCHGSAGYVPKIGSREPHTEPRVWSFTLRKSGGDWKIENARAER
jgi:tetratricopeptide (TPR) repeat protein